jgi:general secretion pathway protein K
MKRSRQAFWSSGTILASNDGIALIMALWALTILSVIVLSFSMMARTETHSAATFKTVVTNRFLAEAGIERGIVEIFFRNANKRQPVVFEGRESVRIDGTPYTGTMEKGQYVYRVTDESGKIPLNALTDSSAVLLKNLLTQMGYQQEIVDTVADSILDWRDQNELHRLNGAESDYYMSLPNPYKAKNANFDTVEELLLVKGVTLAMLYGDGKRKGIIDYVTVYSNRNSINVNAAPREVLMAVPGMTPEKVDYVLAQREGTGIQKTQDIAALLGESFRLIGSYLTNSDSNTFAIDARGKTGEGQKGYGIRAILMVEGAAKYRYVYYKSPAQVGP